MQRSAFASDLLPSPFFPNAAYSNGSAFAWPTSAGGTVASPEGEAGLDSEQHHQQQQSSDGRQTSDPQAQHSGTDSGSGRDSGAGAGESGGNDGPSNGLDDLSQAAQVLSEGRRPGLGGGERTHPRNSGEEVTEGAGDEEEMGRCKRRKT